MAFTLKAILVLAVLLLAAACTSASKAEPVDPTGTAFPVDVAAPSTAAAVVSSRDVVIRQRVGSLAEQGATIHEPHVATPSSATVLLLHGAGGPTRGQLSELSHAIAEMGVVVVNADWLASPSRPMESASDAVCAVAFAQERGHWMGDTGEDSHVIVVGHSGGGQVGMLAALVPEAFSEWCDVASIGHFTRVKVFAYLGLAGDPAAAAEGGNLHRFIKDDPEVRALMDGYTHLGRNPDLIVRFLHGTDDTTVPPERTRAFHNAMVEAGYDSEFTQIDGVGHFGVIDPGNEAVEEMVLAVIADLIAQAP